MSDASSTDTRDNEPTKPRSNRPAVLGLSTDSIGDLHPADLIDNMTALKMLLYRYGEYIDENKRLERRVASLETELQIYTSYRDGYGKKKGNSRTSATLNLIGTVLVGFGVNLSTPTITTGGIVTLTGGILVSVFAALLALRD